MAKKKNNKKKNKSIFQKKFDDKLQKAAKEENLSADERKELSLKRLEGIFSNLGNKENRYLFYCPDMPFASTLTKTVYEFAYNLKQQGFTTCVLHEEHGFEPEWFDEEWAAEVEVDYILPKRRKNSKKILKPNYKFNPTDTVIIPEGFWTVAEGFKDMKPIGKVILALGYGGMITAEPGLDWSHFGFTDVICLSEKLKEDYEAVWPHFAYHVVNYSIDQKQFSPAPIEEIYPAIALSCRNREDAQAIINVFYNRYPFLDMFQFKVLKKLNTESYVDTLKHCCCLLFVDEKAGHPAPPLEALSCEVPTLAVFGRGMGHLTEVEGVHWIEHNDPFLIAESIASFCLEWLQIETKPKVDKKILKEYDSKEVNNKLQKTFDTLQENKIKLFTSIKKAVEEGVLNYGDSNSDTEIKKEKKEESKLKVV